MAGRAGRRGLDRQGTVITLVNDSEVQGAALPDWEDTKLEAITSKVALRFNTVVNLLARFTPSEIEALFANTLAAYQYRQGDHISASGELDPVTLLKEDFDGKLALLRELNFVSDQKLTPSRRDLSRDFRPRNPGHRAIVPRGIESAQTRRNLFPLGGHRLRKKTGRPVAPNEGSKLAAGSIAGHRSYPAGRPPAPTASRDLHSTANWSSGGRLGPRHVDAQPVEAIPDLGRGLCQCVPQSHRPGPTDSRGPACRRGRYPQEVIGVYRQAGPRCGTSPPLRPH